MLCGQPLNMVAGFIMSPYLTFVLPNAHCHFIPTQLTQYQQTALAPPPLPIQLTQATLHCFAAAGS